MIKIAEFNGYEIFADVESGSLIARYEDATENMETRLDPFKLEILDPIEDYLTYVLKEWMELISEYLKEMFLQKKYVEIPHWET